MFNNYKQKLKRLTEELVSLRQTVRNQDSAVALRLWKLENPPKFKIGDRVGIDQCIVPKAYTGTYKVIGREELVYYSENYGYNIHTSNVNYGKTQWNYELFDCETNTRTKQVEQYLKLV